ncbi:hypothetical protein ILYODFUR_033733, partial [Ilyodon furcidens]
EDVILSHYLNRSIEPFLSATTNLPEEAFNWWLHLQSNRQNFSYYKATIHKLFKIFPSNPVLEKPSTDGCRTCAIVGNSVNLKGSHYGPLIDFQDVIIRINYGQVKGYEEDVGTRTTHRVMYPESGSTLDSTTHLVLFAFKIKDLEWLIKSFPTGISGKHRKEKEKITERERWGKKERDRRRKEWRRERWMKRLQGNTPFASTPAETYIITAFLLKSVRYF